MTYVLHIHMSYMLWIPHADVQHVWIALPEMLLDLVWLHFIQKLLQVLGGGGTFVCSVWFCGLRKPAYNTHKHTERYRGTEIKRDTLFINITNYTLIYWQYFWHFLQRFQYKGSCLFVCCYVGIDGLWLLLWSKLLWATEIWNVSWLWETKHTLQCTIKTPG